MDLVQGSLPVGILLTVFLFIAAAALLVFWPTIRILKRLGLTPWMSLLIIIPVGNLLLLWIVAYSDWKHVQVTSNA
jgi:hypothetical protein